MKTTTCLFALVVAFIFSSCGMFKDVSIEKRHYRKGYYVQVRTDRPIEKEVVKEKVNPKEVLAADKAEGENNPSAGEISTQLTPPIAALKSFSKENSKHFSPPSIFKKGKAVFQERDVVFKPKPVEPTPAHDEESAIALVLLIILAILLPPLAVLLVDGLGVHFLIDLIFWLLSFGLVIFVASGGVVYLGIFGLIAIIYALFVVFDII